jgi:hypothetical protein
MNVPTLVDILQPVTVKMDGMMPELKPVTHVLLNVRDVKLLPTIV